MALTKKISRYSEYVRLSAPLREEMEISLRRQANILAKVNDYAVNPSPSASIKRKFAEAFLKVHQSNIEKNKEGIVQLRKRFRVSE